MVDMSNSFWPWNAVHICASEEVETKMAKREKEKKEQSTWAA